MTSASRILPWLFVSGREFATKRESLRNENITHVVFCTTGSSEQFADVGLRYLTLRFEDDERSELAPMVVLATDFVGTARANGGRVLIASDRAVSRCAAVATGVLVQLLNISLRDAFSLVLEMRTRRRGPFRPLSMRSSDSSRTIRSRSPKARNPREKQTKMRLLIMLMTRILMIIMIR
jgi:hypothetical protein